MKNCFLYILPLLLAVVPASCVYDYPAADAPADDDTRVWLTFTLAVDQANGTAPTRTTWEDNYASDSGTARENHIDPDDVQVLIYSTGQAPQRIAQVENLACIQAEGGYTYHGELAAPADRLQAGERYKIMVLANCGGINNTNDIPDLTFTEENTDYIPMWGVTTATLALTPGLSQDLGRIDLLRAQAKIEVVLGEAPATEYTITRITLNRRNTTGYCLPGGWSTVAETKLLERESDTPASFRPYSSLASNAGRFTVAGNDQSAAYYLPEYAKDDANPAQLTITLAKDDKAKDYTLDLKDYTTDAYYDLVRNHIYRYTVTGVQDGELTVNYRVLPWEKVTSGITYGDIECELLPEGGDSGNAAKGDPEAIFGILHKPTYASSHDFSVLKPGTAGATYEFTLTAPEGAVWTAHLSNNKDFYFSDSTIDTDNDGTKETKMVSTGIARAGKYYIQINATNPWQEIEDENGETLPNAEIDFDSRSAWGAQVEAEHRVVETYFYITILADGDMQEKELEINPTLQTTTHFVDNRRFPGTATRIWIRQVPAQKGRSGEDQPGAVWNAANLAANVNPTDEDFQWWRVNPYWAH